MPRGISVLSSHILTSQYRGPHIYNMADDSNGGGDADKGDKGDDKGDGAGGDQDKGKDDKKKPDDTEGRITQLAKEKKELEKKLKDREDADKKAAEDALAQKGEHEKLAQQREEERNAAQKERDEAKQALAEYEEMATGQIEASLKTITDAEKKKAVQSMLEGLSVREQMKKLPELMKLAGASAPTFGGSTPKGDKTPTRRRKNSNRLASMHFWQRRSKKD